MDVIENILVNIFSNCIYNTSCGIIERVKARRFRKELVRWTNSYIISHDGTVLTSSDFFNFLTNHKIIEQIFYQMSCGNDKISKDEFINEKVQFFNKNRSSKLNYNDIIDVKNFITYFYEKIENYYINNLSQNEKYIVSKLNEIINIDSKIEDKLMPTNCKLDEILSVLNKQSSLLNSEQVWNIYQKISTLIYQGNISDVMTIFPLISGKSNDLEFGIGYLLGIYSNELAFFQKYEQNINEITDDRIFSDITRTVIYYSIFKNDKHMLEKISNRNKELYKIAQSIINEDLSDFYTIQSEEKDSINYLTYKLVLKYQSEQWLIKRICVLDLLEQPIFNSVEVINEIIGDSSNIIDNIILQERKIIEIANKVTYENIIDNSLKDEAKRLKHLSVHMNSYLKEKIFCIIIRSALIQSGDISLEIIQGIPNELKGNKEIELLCLQVEMQNNNADVKKIIDVSMQYNEYWVLNNYLLGQVDRDPELAKKTIEDHRFLLDKVPSIFIIYIGLLQNLNCSAEAITLLDDFKEKYGIYIEYWIERLKILFSETDLKNVIESYKSNRIKMLSPNSPILFIRTLMHFKKYDDVLFCIERINKVSNLSNELLKYKAISLNYIGHEIEALEIFKHIFSEEPKAEEIVYYILALSINNCRTPSEDVLNYAEKSDNYQINLLVSSYYASLGDLDKALFFNLKALFTIPNGHNDAYGQYIGLSIQNEKKENLKPEFADFDSVIYLKSVSPDKKTCFAIHSKEVLPSDCYLWKGVTNIYKDYAIRMGLFRKKIGDSVVIDKIEYIIESIESLSSFLFRISMNEIVKAGKAKMITLPIKDNGETDIEQFTQILKESINDDNDDYYWLNQYQDLNQIPATFHLYKKYVRCNYFQLVKSIICDKNIFYREFVNDTPKHQPRYIFTYSALIVLFKLGWKPCEKSKYYIPKSIIKSVSNDSEKNILDNSREHVSAMGVNNGQLYYIESTEEQKLQSMKELTEFEDYCKLFDVLENNNDLIIDSTITLNLKEIVEITDYDAIVIAQSNNLTVVSAESMIFGLVNMKEIAGTSVCMVDFLVDVCESEIELLNYIKLMMQFKFTVPFSYNAIAKISDIFCASDENGKDIILNLWQEILEIPLEDIKYKSCLLPIVDYCKFQLKNSNLKINAVFRMLLLYGLKYANQKIQLLVDEQGEMTVKIVSEE